MVPADVQRRISISVSEEAVKLLDRLAPKGDRRRCIERLVKRTARERMELRARLKVSKRDALRATGKTAPEWDPLADEVWQRDVRR